MHSILTQPKYEKSYYLVIVSRIANVFNSMRLSDGLVDPNLNKKFNYSYFFMAACMAGTSVYLLSLKKHAELKTKSMK